MTNTNLTPDRRVLRAIRRTVTTALLGFAPAIAIAAAPITMHRDPGCGCCMAWAAQVRAAFGQDVQVVDDAQRPAFQRKVGVPAHLSGCHTAIIAGYAFEGHVPIADIKRLIASKPKGVRGLAVPGMPLGSPGMEAGGRKDRFDTVAFGTGKPVVFARH